jgi:hypothetical protein
MSRQRFIWPDIWDDPNLAAISTGAHLLYIACFSLADDDGRLDGSPVFLASHAFAYRAVTTRIVKHWRDECENARDNFLVYSVNRREYIAFTDWSEWQHPKYPSPSKIPPPQLSLDIDSGNGSPNASGNDSPTGWVGKGRDGSNPNGLDTLSRPENPIWDVVSEIWGEPLSNGKSKAARGLIVSNFREILVRDGITEGEAQKDEIRRRHTALAADWGKGKATARSLVNNWKVAGQLADGSGKLGLSAEDMARQAIEDHERGL